jgi:hypothetical protein
MSEVPLKVNLVKSDVDPHRACTHNKGVMNGAGYIPHFHHVALSLVLL